MDEELRDLERRSKNGDISATAALVRARARIGHPSADVWAGIDPGKMGWAVVLKPDGTLKTWAAPVVEEEDGPAKYDLRVAVEVAREFKALGVRIVMLERQQPAYRAPGQDKAFNNLVRASFTIGYGFAMWETALTAADVKYELVMPGVWKKGMGITASKEVTERAARAQAVKGNSVNLAALLWPEHDFRRTPRCKPSPDQAEAALLAEYGRRKYGGAGA